MFPFKRNKNKKKSFTVNADNEDWSGCADEQANLSLRWVHMAEGKFSHVLAHFIWNIHIQSTLVTSTSFISNNRFSKWKSGPCLNMKI